MIARRPVGAPLPPVYRISALADAGARLLVASAGVPSVLLGWLGLAVRDLQTGVTGWALTLVLCAFLVVLASDDQWRSPVGTGWPRRLERWAFRLTCFVTLLLMMRLADLATLRSALVALAVAMIAGLSLGRACGFILATAVFALRAARDQLSHRGRPALDAWQEVEHEGVVHTSLFGGRWPQPGPRMTPAAARHYARLCEEASVSLGAMGQILMTLGSVIVGANLLRVPHAFVGTLAAPPYWVTGGILVLLVGYRLNVVARNRAVERAALYKDWADVSAAKRRVHRIAGRTSFP